MGNTVKKISNPEKTATVYSLPNTVYSLDFSGFITANNNMRIRTKHCEEARALLQDSSFWVKPLESTMRAAIMKMILDSTGNEVTSLKVPPVLDIEIVLNPQKGRYNTHKKYHEISGNISWRSVTTDNYALAESLAYRLTGGVMIGILGRNWSYYINPHRYSYTEV